VTSYVTCKVDRAQMAATGLMVGTIAMVATALRARGQGWALATTFGALRWFTEQGTQVVEVGTQLRNVGAASLYQKAGFRPTAATFTFRKLLP
jgi:GNAT superfamily N-acetyltransferase